MGPDDYFWNLIDAKTRFSFQKESKYCDSASFIIRGSQDGVRNKPVYAGMHF